MPSSLAIGPLTISTWPAPPVVTALPPRLNSSRSAAFIEATTTGKYSGRQPAITAFTASFSRVTFELLGWMRPREPDGAPP